MDFDSDGVARRLRNAMRANRMSIYRLSEISGVSDSTINRMIRFAGNRAEKAACGNMLKVCDSLGVSVDWVLRGSRSDRERFIMQFDSLPLDQKEAVDRLVQAIVN